MLAPTIIKIRLNNYSRNGLDWNNDCGITLYRHYWTSEKVRDEKMFQEIKDSKVYNTAESGGLEPLAMTLYSGMNEDVGKYTYRFEARMSKVNLDLVFFPLDITIDVQPCQTSDARTNGQTFSKKIVYYKQPLDMFVWDEFEQFPACNYTWKYYVHMKKALDASSPALK